MLAPGFTSQVLIRLLGGDATAPGSHDQLAAQQEWLDFVFQRVAADIHRVGDRFQTCWSADENSHQRIEIPAILFVETQVIDSDHVERGGGQLIGDLAVRLALGIVANPKESIVGQSWCAAASPRDHAAEA